MSTPKTSLFASAYEALMTSDPLEKKVLVDAMAEQWQQGMLSLEPVEVKVVTTPGRPARPELVPPRQLVKRKISTLEGRAVIVHAVAHIEFNAMNLALDALYRFQDLPEDYYHDWLLVSKEEAYHCSLMLERLDELGYSYGDFPAHNGLWEMAVSTGHRLLDRMGMVPRVFEARGLDVTPPMIHRFKTAGDKETVSKLEIILRDEIGHVAIGNRWFEYACEQEGVEVIPTFQKLLQKYMQGQVRGPFHTEARLQAGFTQNEMDILEAM